MSRDDRSSIVDEAQLEAPSPGQVGAWVERVFRRGDLNPAREFGIAKRAQQHARRSRERQHRELPSWIDPHDLSRAGWGVILPPRRKTHLADRLAPLLKRRKTQAGSRYQEYTYRPGRSAEWFLKDKGETLGTIKPSKVPYYLLIAGSPEEVPFEFQYHLSLSHAVGRVWFPQLSSFRDYAEAVCRAERDGVELPRKVTIFAVENDAVTRAIGEQLVPALKQLIADGFPNWRLETLRGDEAWKSRLSRRLGGGKTPGLLFVSTHGRHAPEESDRDLVQGSLLCEPDPGAPVTDEPVLYGATDLADKPMDLHGLIACFAACYSAGTPKFDNFPHTGLAREAALETAPRLISKKPFLASLPVTMLERGALAVVGHVDRGWTTSFVWALESGDVGTLYSLEDAVTQLLRGQRLGHALRPLTRRYSQLASRLAQMLDVKRIGGHPDLHQLGFYWTAVNDARNFVILGDPAVYLLGRRPPAVTVQLEPRQLLQIERLAGDRSTAEAWIRKTIDQHLG